MSRPLFGNESTRTKSRCPGLHLCLRSITIQFRSAGTRRVPLRSDGIPTVQDGRFSNRPYVTVACLAQRLSTCIGCHRGTLRVPAGVELRGNVGAVREPPEGWGARGVWGCRHPGPPRMDGVCDGVRQRASRPVVGRSPTLPTGEIPVEAGVRYLARSLAAGRSRTAPTGDACRVSGVPRKEGGRVILPAPLDSRDEQKAKPV